MTEEKTLTPQESLDMITAMIRQAKGNMQKSSFYFLLWGWTLVIVNLSAFALANYTSFQYPFAVYGLLFLAAIIAVVKGIRDGRRKSAPTIIGDVTKWMWSGFGITCFIFAFFGKNIGWQINPIIITMCAVPTFITGVMLHFKPLMFGGIVFWVLGTLTFMTPLQYQPLLTSVAITLGYLIPGYMLKKSEG